MGTFPASKVFLVTSRYAGTMRRLLIAPILVKILLVASVPPQPAHIAHDGLSDALGVEKAISAPSMETTFHKDSADVHGLSFANDLRSHQQLSGLQIPPLSPSEAPFDQAMLDALLHDLSHVSQDVASAKHSNNDYLWTSFEDGHHLFDSPSFSTLPYRLSDELTNVPATLGHDQSIHDYGLHKTLNDAEWTNSSPGVETSSRRRAPEIWNEERLKERAQHPSRNREDVPEVLRKIPLSVPPMQVQEGRITRFVWQEKGDIRDRINKRVFDGRLKWVGQSTIPNTVKTRHRKSALRPNYALPFVDLPMYRPSRTGGIIKQVRMTIHGGPWGRVEWPKGHPLEGKTFFNFWGIPEDRSGRAKRLVHHYGTGYLDNSDILTVETYQKRLSDMITKHGAHFRA